MIAKCKENKFTIIFLLFLFCYFGFSISKVCGFVLLPDEFGYWTYAARLQGYDWSEFTSLSSYYSYGYSLFLWPFFAIFQNSVVAYRMAVSTNFVFLIFDFFLLKFLITRLWGEGDKNFPGVFAAIAILYPSWLYYAKTAMVEVILMTFYLVIAVLLYKYVETGNNIYLVLLSVTTVYIHFLHMRAIGIGIAVVVTLLIYLIKNRKQFIRIALAIVFIGVLFVVGLKLKEYMQAMTYSNINESTASISINDYAGQFSKLRAICSMGKIPGLIVSILTKLLYISLATFGLAPLGLYRLIRECIRLPKSDKRVMTYLFLILSSLAQIGIAAIYISQPYSIDALLYGRYHELIAIILMPLGLMELTERQHLLYKLGAILGSNVILCGVASWWIYAKQIGLSRKGCMMIGLIMYKDVKDTPAQEFLWVTCAIGSLLTAGVFLIWLVKKQQIRYGLLILVMVIEIVLSVRASALYWDGYARAAYRDLYLAETIDSLVDRDAERKVVFIRNGSSSYIDIICFMLRDISIDVIDRTENLDKDSIVIMDYTDSFIQEIQEQYDRVFTYGHFTLLYNMGE